MLWVRALVIWVIMAIAAIANGILREGILNKLFGATYTLPISGVLLCVLILAIIYASINVFVATKSSIYLALGVFWVWLTLSFEYGLDYFVVGMTLSEINQTLAISEGNLFTLVLIVMLFGPAIMAWIKKQQP